MTHATVNKKRDQFLSDLGPYSKRLAGLTYVSNKRKGESIELSTFVCPFRRSTELPNELKECSFYPLYAAPDLSRYAYRFTVTDGVSAIVTYDVDGARAHVTTQIINDTPLPQSATLHYLIGKRSPQGTSLATDGEYIDPLNYTRINCTNKFDGLTPDGKLIGEISSPDYVDGTALGGDWGAHIGDSVTYCVKRGTLSLHASGNGTLALSGSATGEITLTPQMQWYDFATTDGELTITATTGGYAVMDAMALGATVKNIRIKTNVLRKDVYNDYAIFNDESSAFAIKWHATPDFVRDFLTDKPDEVMSIATHDHVRKTIGNSDTHCFTNAFFAPIFLLPNERKTFAATVITGEYNTVKNSIESAPLTQKPYALPQNESERDTAKRLLTATLLTNVVFPTRCQGEYIRHFTPGKWWDCLYTWDTGFISLALSDINPDFAHQVLSDYLVEDGNIHAAFVHHGSMVPVQAFAYKKLYETTLDKQFLASHYAEMKRYYDFFVGKGKSQTKHACGMLTTLKYFYNAGGWDDYPPQKYTDSNGLRYKTVPVISTVMGIEFARIMQLFATILGFDSKVYTGDIAQLTAALENSYDHVNGYYSYQVEDEHGKLSKLYYDENTNFNMGLDGVYPALSGVIDEERKSKLLAKIMDERAMWTDYGICVVDKSAPYYTPGGYWNGSVWMPHQWFAFLGMLQNNRPLDAIKIAKTAVKTYSNETRITHRCYEHFMSANGRGAGWHAFGGLSSPVINWLNILYGEGIVTPTTVTVTDKTDKSYKLIALDTQPHTVVVSRKLSAKVLLVNGEMPEFTAIDNAYFITLSGATEYEIIIR